MLTDHIHCAECLRPILTQVPTGGGKSKPAEIQGGMQLRAMPDPAQPGRVTFVPAQVPLCNECGAKINAEAESAQAQSKIIVPGVAKTPVGLHLARPKVGS